MHFQHSSEIWRDFPELVPGVLVVDGITADVVVDERIAALTAYATRRLETASESELPEIQAWRRAFSRMGLKPTQYRCAAESLLRRYRKEKALPRIHPLIDICNAVSLAFATPVAVFDIAQITGSLEVRYAVGDETYLTFARTTESPDAHEVIFADGANQAHARRWTNRQSGLSAIRDTTTTTALIVAESLHVTALADTHRLIDTLTDELAATWSTSTKSAILTAAEARYDF